MRNSLKIFILLLIISGLGFLLALFLFRDVKEPESIVSDELEATDMEMQNLANFQTLKFTYAAWIPSWGSFSGLSSLKQNSQLLNSISPVWYEINSDGSLKNHYPSQREEIIKVAKENNIELIPAIAMFDHELFTKVLQSQENLDRHVAAILSSVIDNGYDGIDLDYESTKLSDKAKYYELLDKLHQGLQDNNKKLIVTVIAKWGDWVIYPSLKETRQVQDWSEIAKYADEIRIMAYDYTFARSAFPGPIAPVNWIEEVVKYAVTKADPAKFVLGIHLYSYEWKGSADSPLVFIHNYMGNSSGNVDASSYVYSQVKNIIKDNNGRAFDFEGEKVFEYKKDGIFRSLVYIDPAGIDQRIKIALDNKLGGVVFWRLGGEDELLSNLYNAD